MRPCGSAPDPPRRTPPVPALLAAPLGWSAPWSSGFGFIALAFSNGQFDGGGWLVVLGPAVLTVALVIGVVLPLLGRSWLALTVPAGALGALLLVTELSGWWDTGMVSPVAALFPAGAAGLAALPAVRRWVPARRAVRAAR